MTRKIMGKDVLAENVEYVLGGSIDKVQRDLANLARPFLGTHSALELYDDSSYDTTNYVLLGKPKLTEEQRRKKYEKLITKLPPEVLDIVIEALSGDVMAKQTCINEHQRRKEKAS